MSNLEFNLTSCVRATSKASDCTKCLDICPVKTIDLASNIPSFVPNDCIDCGGCVGVCPTESFSLSNKDHVQFFFENIENDIKEFSCKENVPCLSWFSVDHMISYVLASKDNISMDLSHCATCEIKEPLLEQIQSNIKESNNVLEALNSSHRIEVIFDTIVKDKLEEVIEEEIPDETNDRRSFLKKFSLKGAVQENEKFKQEVEDTQTKEFKIELEDIASIRDKVIPFKRKILWSVLKNKDNIEPYNYIENDSLSFISTKIIDDSCTNCQICYRICPTGALSSNTKFSLINFDPLTCVKCNLCHDVCEPDSIHLQTKLSTEVFVGTQKKTLIKFESKRCNECGNHFTYKGGELICPRCETEEDESYALHNISKTGGLNF